MNHSVKGGLSSEAWMQQFCAGIMAGQMKAYSARVPPVLAWHPSTWIQTHRFPDHPGNCTQDKHRLGVTYLSLGTLLTLNSVCASRLYMTTTSCMCLLQTVRADSAGCQPLKKVIRLIYLHITVILDSTGMHSTIACESSFWPNISPYQCWW